MSPTWRSWTCGCRRPTPTRACARPWRPGPAAGLPILVLSQYVEEQYATELIGGGAAAVGYLLKERVADVAEFLDACAGWRPEGRSSTPR